MADISDLGGDGGEYARTGILVENKGIDQAKSELLGLADTGDAVAARVGAAASAGATKFSQAFVESSARSQQVLATQIGTLTQLTAGWDSASATARDSAVKLAAAIEQSGRMASATEAQVTALAEAQAVLSGAQSGATAAATQVTDATRAMTLTQIAAIEINEGLVASSGRVIDAHRSMALAQVAAIAEDEKRTNSVRTLIGAEQAAYAEEARRQASLRAMAAAEQAAYVSEAQREAGIRRMALAEIEAIKIDEARNAAATGGAGKLAQLTAAYDSSTGGIGRLRQGFVSLAAQMTGTNAVVDRTVTTLSGFALGNTAVLGIVAAVAAAGAAYNLLTEDTRKAKEEQDKLTASLDAWYDKERAGPTGELESQIGAKLKELESARVELGKQTSLGNLRENLKAALDVLTDTSFNPQTEGDKFERLWAEYTKRQIDAIRKGAAEVAAAGREAFFKQQKDIEDAATKQTTDVSSLVSGGKATSSQVALDAKSLGEYQKELRGLQIAYDGITDAKAKAFNLSEQVSAASNIKTIGDALRENLLRPMKEQVADAALAIESLNAYVAANQKVLDSIQKNGDAIRTGAAANADANRVAEQATALARTDGLAHEFLANQYKAENATIEANRTLTGIALTERLATIDAVKREGDETIRTADLHSRVVAIMARATEEAKRQDEALQQANRDLQGIGSTLERDLLHGIEQFSERGITSVRSFFSEAARLSTQMVGQIDASIKKLSNDWVNVFVDGGDTTKLDAELEKLRTFKAIAGDVGAAVVGGFAGFNVGRATNNVGYGELAGGAAGATAGFEVGGLPGAIVGAFGGVIGGLLGAAEAHKAAAHAIEEAGKSLATNITAFGSTNSTQAALAANDTKQQQLDAQAEALLHDRAANARGGPEEVSGYIQQYAQDVAKIDAAAAANRIQISLDFTAGITEQLNALKGTSGAYENQLTALKKAYDENVTSATVLGLSTDDITKLYNAQVAAAKAAYDEGQSQLRASENAREAAAKGESYLVDQITRRAAEDKELFDDSVAGYTAAELARVKYIQGLEDETAALDARNAANNTLASALAQGPTGTLATQQAADLQPLTDKLAADATNYQAALDLLASDIANGADDATIAADKYGVLTESILVSGDQANITAEKFKAAAAAMQQAQSDIQRDISLGFISKDTGRTEEANAFGFGGLSDDQIRALYTAFSGAPLTNAQEQTNKNIEQFFKDFPTVLSTVAADTASAASKTPSPSDAVSYSAKSLTEVTGNRMADILSGTQAIERQQLQLWEKYFGFSGLSSSNSAATPSGSYAAQSIGYQSAGNRVAGQDLAALFPSAPSAPASAPSSVAPQQGSGSRTVTLNINVRVNADGKVDRSDLEQLGKDIAGYVRDEIVREENLQRYVGGSPLLPGK